MNESESLMSEDQLLDALEEVTNSWEAAVKENLYLREELTKAQTKNSSLSSQNSEMKKELLEKSEIIVKQKEADLILEENKKLKISNQKLQEDAKKSCEESEAVRAEYHYKESVLSTKEDRLDRRERELNKRSDDIDKEVSSKVINRISTIQDGYDARYERRKADLEEAFDRKKMKMMFVMLVSLLYSITTTVFTAVINVTVRKDIMVFFETIFKTVGEMIFEEWKYFGELALISERIEIVILDKIVFAVIQVFPMLAINILLLGGIGYVGYNYSLYVKEKQADIISITAVLIAVAVPVYFAVPIKGVLGLNLIVLQIILYGAYSLIRGVIQMKDHEQRRTIIIYSCAFAVMIMIVYTLFHTIWK